MSPKTTAPIVNMFWHGPQLGVVHAACIRSFLRQGHPVVLHCYDPPADIPEGVEVFDASRIMSRGDVITNSATGSAALGADRYRYRILQTGMGLYADCDMYCLRPIPDADYIFGREDSRAVNVALLKYPPDSDLARALVADTAREDFIPPWLSPRRKRLLKARRRLGLGLSVRKMPWGVWGPKLLTWWIDRLGLGDRAQPIDRFYPLHYFCTDLLFEPGLRIEDLATPRTLAVHLCHKLQPGVKPPPDSPLGRIVAMA